MAVVLLPVLLPVVLLLVLQQDHASNAGCSSQFDN
jgi:hypothetical protein